MENGATVYDDIVKLKETVIHIRKESIKGNLVGKDTLKDVVGIGEDDVAPLLARLPDFSGIHGSQERDGWHEVLQHETP